MTALLLSPEERDRERMRRAAVSLYFGSASALRRVDLLPDEPAHAPFPTSAAGRRVADGVIGASPAPTTQPSSIQAIHRNPTKPRRPFSHQ